MKRKTNFPKAIFYDSKNTLFDWSTVWVKASSNIVRRYESSVSGEDFKKIWHKFLVMVNHRVAFSKYQDFTETLRESLIYTFKYFNIPGVPEDVRYMTDLWEEVVPFPDTHAALREQQELTKILIFSNVETRYLEMMVKKVDHFKPDFIGDMEKARVCKPSPRAYLWVLEKVKLKAKDVLYCARPQWDVQGAIACGMKTVWLNRAEEELEGMKPDYEVGDLHGVTSLLRELLSPLNRRKISY